MDTTLLAVAAIVAIALVFDFTNGFHDAANAIATSISTRALTPRVALLMAAFFNLVGAIGWNLLTWWFGLPSSSSHALIGGLGGAALAASATVKWHGILEKVVIPMVISPIVGVILGYLVMLAILWLFRGVNPGRASRGFRLAQTVSAAAMALGHGLQDASKTAGVVVLALTVGGYHTGDSIPLWVLAMSAVVISAGTYSGGWRIMRTLGRRIIHLGPPQGFAAEATASSILYVAAITFGAPISTTHTITSSIMGVGATKRLSAVRWGVAGNIVGAWVLTFPGAGLVAAACYGLVSLFR